MTTNRLVDDMFHWFGQYFFKTPEMGAQTTIYCATEPSLSDQTGLYYRLYTLKIAKSDYVRPTGLICYQQYQIYFFRLI